MNKILFIVTLILLISCLDSSKKKNNVDPDLLYFQYQISAAEREPNVVVYLQFLKGNKGGVAETLTPPAKVLLDGESLATDSARLTGSYYEILKPRVEFAGKHEIVFTNSKGKEFKEEFSFTPFKLKTNIPAVLNRGDLNFSFEGLEKTDVLRVVATDTSFASNDINQFDTVKNGRLVIPEALLHNLVNGPISIIFSKEVERPVKNGTSAGGRIEVSYELRREFRLGE